MCQCRLTHCHQGVTLGGMSIMGEALHVGEQGVYGKSLYLSSILL